MKTSTLLFCLFFVSFTWSQTVNNSMYRNSQSTNDGKSWFRLSGEMGYSPILIGFIPDATDGYEDNFDGQFINEGAAIEFYSYCENYKLEIQGRSELQPNQVIQIPLGYQVTAAGDYTISIVLEYIDPNFQIVLEDTLAQTTTDLRTSNYTFNVVNPIEDNSRFILSYIYNSPTLGLDEFVAEPQEVHTYFFNDELVSQLKNGNSPTTIQLFNVTGKEILKASYTTNLTTYGIPKGIYIVKYTSMDSKTIIKKIIKT